MQVPIQLIYPLDMIRDILGQVDERRFPTPSILVIAVFCDPSHQTFVISFKAEFLCPHKNKVSLMNQVKLALDEKLALYKFIIVVNYFMHYNYFPFKTSISQLITPMISH